MSSKPRGLQRNLTIWLLAAIVAAIQWEFARPRRKRAMTNPRRRFPANQGEDR